MEVSLAVRELESSESHVQAGNQEAAKGNPKADSAFMVDGFHGACGGGVLFDGMFLVDGSNVGASCSHGGNIESSRVGFSALPISLGRQRPPALCNGPNRGARLLAPDAARSERPIQKVVLPFLDSEALAPRHTRGSEKS